ncbi:MAG: hypothetical protein BIFFINMI_00794 [Phycisphaerae bacterium]|nr:hypothetical protein [Phycisphaerae bacterium]
MSVALRRGRKPRLSREAAMSARPRKSPIVRRTERENGGALITLMAPKPRWMRLIGGGGMIERTFGLDRMGVEVYDACDGRTSVKRLVSQFAGGHSLDLASAEHAVATFLRTMMGRGLIVMELERGGQGSGIGAR